MCCFSGAVESVTNTRILREGIQKNIARGSTRQPLSNCIGQLLNLNWGHVSPLYLQQQAPLDQPFGYHAWLVAQPLHAATNDHR